MIFSSFTKFKHIRLFLIVGAFLFTKSVEGQSIQEYFVPDSPNNTATYYFNDPTGERNSTEVTKHYLNVGVNCEVHETGRFGQTDAEDAIIKYELTNTEIKEIMRISAKYNWDIKLKTLIKGNENDTIRSLPPETILKMPLKGKTMKWNSVDVHGEKIKCSASWTTVQVDGSKKDAIKVLQGEQTYYYVKGIGFWGTDSLINGEPYIQSRLERLYIE